MKILPYNRLVNDLGRRTPAELVRALGKQVQISEGKRHDGVAVKQAAPAATA